MPDLTIPLHATLTALDELGLQDDLEQFAAPHWTLPGQPLEALDALLLGPATPATSPCDLALGLDWGKNRFGPLLGTASPEAWQRLLRRSMRRRFRQVRRRYQGPGVSPATRSRYRITFIGDITTLLKVGEMLGLADLFYSGMLHRPAHSIEVVMLYALVGDDYLCLPLDFHLRKPDPKGSGHPCLDGMALAQKMMEDLHHAMRVHFLKLDGHYLVADAWFADGGALKRARQIGLIPIGRGKTSFVFTGTLLGQPFHGTLNETVLRQTPWPWKRSPQAPDIPYVRLKMHSDTFGPVVLTICDWPGEETPGYWLCLAPEVSSPRIIRAYGRRPWIEACFEGCKSTLRLEQCKFRSPGGIYGFIALRLLSFALFDYAGRRVTQGRLTGGQIIRTLRYHGTLWLKQLLENKALSAKDLANSWAA